MHFDAKRFGSHELCHGEQPLPYDLTNSWRPDYRGSAKYLLRKDPQGETELFQRFWSSELTYHDLAPPLVVYVDLLASGNDRNREAARMIYEREILELIGQD